MARDSLGCGPRAAICFRMMSIGPEGLRFHVLAEEEGFEPPYDLRRKRFSRPPVSTTHPFLRLPYYRRSAIIDGSLVRAGRRTGQPRCVRPGRLAEIGIPEIEEGAVQIHAIE